ncbi:hypothetical protein M422DRAFT_23063 [Sphaerobolus stellatus SS14]|nr:hypothetical protein M422DRAFT_23063 [Sphaerobolus stellatus SS14]
MPTTARISVPVKQTTPPKIENEASLKTPASVPRPKARVAPRRRARRRGEDVTDSEEEELIREPRSDSETESSASTILDSEDDSDSDDNEKGSKSEARADEVPQASSKEGESSSSIPEQSSSMFTQPQNWAEEMADADANGDGSVEVIQWGDMASHDRPTTPPVNAVPSPPPSDKDKRERTRGGAPRGSTKRQPGESARQAYLNRLTNDPAYVPTVGQFWSHDDRLLDKDLRSLSGWWRGRWQGRGRGVRGRGGFGVNFGMRGRGGFAGNTGHQVEPANVPPVDRTWTHDGFDELNNEGVIQDRPQNGWSRDRGFSRGRGGAARGRGFFGRGGFTSTTRSSSPHGSQPHAPTESHHSTVSDKLQFGNGTRPWFSMKPEPVWTRQSENFLFKVKPVQNQGIRIKLPSSNPEGKKDPIVVTLPALNGFPAHRPVRTTNEKLPPNSIAVKLPSAKSKGKQREQYAVEDVVTVEPPPMDDPIAALPSKEFVPQVRPIAGSSAPREWTTTAPPAPPIPSAVETVPQGVFSVVSPIGPTVAQSSQLEYQQPAEPIAVPIPAHPTVQVQPPMPPVGSPFQPSPSYGSPYAYGASGVPLPPGIGILDNGMTYEIATGRAVYLQTPPPPPQPSSMAMPVFTPRPMHLHHASHGSVHFVPHHGHSMSMSVSPPAMMHTPPLFSLPRQNSRVEIKAPGEERGKEREVQQPRAVGHTRAPSTLAVNVNAEPFTPSSQMATQNMAYYDAQQHAYEDAQRQQQQQQYMYPQPGYYYPMPGADGAVYGYGQQYVEQTNPYGDAYVQEQYPPPTTYY